MSNQLLGERIRGNSKEEGGGEHNRVDAHWRKERSLQEERRNKAHVPVAPREQESSKRSALRQEGKSNAQAARETRGR